MLNAKYMKTLNLSTAELGFLQTNVETFVEPIAQIPLLDGNFVQAVAISGTTVQVAHRLGRTPRGYFVTNKNGPLDTWQLTADQTYPTQYLVLRFAGSATSADFWIF